MCDWNPRRREGDRETDRGTWVREVRCWGGPRSSYRSNWIWSRKKRLREYSRKCDLEGEIGIEKKRKGRENNWSRGRKMRWWWQGFGIFFVFLLVFYIFFVVEKVEVSTCVETLKQIHESKKLLPIQSTYLPNAPNQH